MSIRSRSVLFALAACFGPVLFPSSSAYAQSLDIDWRAYGRASSLSVAQALPQSEEECKDMESTEVRIAEGLSAWRLPDVDRGFFIGLYEGYVDELGFGREFCRLGDRLPGRSVARVAASMASAMWEGTLRNATPARAKAAIRELGQAVEFDLSPSESVACKKLLADDFFRLSAPTKSAIDAGEIEMDSLLTFVLIPWELSEFVCKSTSRVAEQ